MGIDIGRIVIDGLAGVGYVTDFKIDIKPNEHATCAIRATLKDENYKINTEDLNKLVSLRDNSSGIILFSGYMSQIRSCQMQIEVSLTSCSIDLDLCKRKRTFQDINYTYDQIANLVAEQDNGYVVCNEENTDIIGKVLYQYDESDWEFLKRIAGLARTCLYPNTGSTKPIIYMGVSNITEQAVENVLETSKCTLDFDDCNSFDRKRDGIKIKCFTNLSVGVKMLYKGKLYTIISKYVYVEKSLVLFEYVLADCEVAVQKQIVNYKACGVVLKGEVNEVLNDAIRIKLDIDQSYKKSKLSLYPWNTITGNLLYCMPEIRSRVILNLNDANGSEAKVISCMRKNTPSICSDNKVFMVPSGKKLELNNNEAVFLSIGTGGETSKILLNGTEETSMSSTGMFSMNTIFENVQIDTMNFNLTAPNEIKMKKDDIFGINLAALSMNATIEISGNEVSICGEARIQYSPFNDSPKDTGLRPASILKLALKVLLTVAVVAVACVVAVALAPAAIATSAVVAGVIGTCALGGATLATVAVYSQYKNDKENGINRSFWDYAYMAADKFCTGAILTAPIAACPIGGLGGFGLKMLGTAKASVTYQSFDNWLDDVFHNDFYDNDSTIVGTMIYDVLCNGVGEIFGAALGKVFSGADKIIRAKFPYLNVINRTTARQYLRSSQGVNAMKQWRTALENALKAQEKYGKGSTFLKDTISDLIAFLDNQYFNDADPILTDEHQEMEFEQYFDFDSNGNLIMCN